jgi:hypothetical protein
MNLQKSNADVGKKNAYAGSRRSKDKCMSWCSGEKDPAQEQDFLPIVSL